MLTTYNSHPRRGPGHPDAQTKVQDTDPASVSILREINLFLLGRNIVWKWCRSIEASGVSDLYAYKFKTLQSLIQKTPSEYDLRDQEYFSNPITYYYRNGYVEYSSSSTDRISRPVMLVNVTNLLNFMNQWHDRFREALPEHYRPAYDRLYAETVEAFEAWIAVARPPTIPSVSELRQTQERGRVLRQPRRVPTLLALMHDLSEQ
jgi:hypothetical protein